MKNQNFKLIITNLSRNVKVFRLEPWGDEKEIMANESIIVKAEGPKDGILEFECSEEQITIYGWEGSICEIEE